MYVIVRNDKLYYIADASCFGDHDVAYSSFSDATIFDYFSEARAYIEQHSLKNHQIVKVLQRVCDEHGNY